MHSHLPEVILFVLTLLFVASLVATFATRARLPLSVVLVVVGLLMGVMADAPGLGFLHAFHLTPEIVFFIFLPALIFESAFNLDVRRLTRNLGPVVALAVPALLISVVVVAVFLHTTSHVPAAAAILFGALISATDPVAVLAMFKELGAPKRLAVLVEGESLFNDGTALVLFAIVLAVIEKGSFGVGDVVGGVVKFAWVCVGGAAIGLLLAAVCAHLVERVDNQPMIEITLTAVLAHLSFLVADHFAHVSGVIATVMAGLVMGSYGKTKISPQVHEFMEAFWEYAAFVANAMIFLLVGLSADLPRLFHSLPLVLAAIVATTLARALAVYGFVPLVNRVSAAHNIDLRYQTIIFYGDLRGAVGLAMALALQEAEFLDAVWPGGRALILDMTLGIVLFTLIVKGLSLRRVIGWLGLDRLTVTEAFEKEQALLQADRMVEGVLQRLESQGGPSERLYHRFRDQYHQWSGRLQAELGRLRTHMRELAEGRETRLTCAQFLGVELEHYWEMYEAGDIGEAAMRRLNHWVEDEMDHLRSHGHRLAMRLHDPYTDIPPLPDVPAPPALKEEWRREREMEQFEITRAQELTAAAVLSELEEMVSTGAVAGAAAQPVREHYTAMRAHAQAAMRRLREDKPDFVDRMESLMATRYCLTTEQRVFEKLHAKGLISDKVLSTLSQEVEERAPGLRHRPVGQLLVRQGKVSERQLAEALESVRAADARVAETLVQMGYVTDEDVAQALEQRDGGEEDDDE